MPELLGHAHGHLADPGRKLCRPRRLDRARPPRRRLTSAGNALVRSGLPKPLDEGVSAGQNYLYVLAAGLNQIVGYRVGADGSLTQVTTVPVATGSAGVGAS